jgi:hypothetical protein
MVVNEITYPGSVRKIVKLRKNWPYLKNSGHFDDILVLGFTYFCLEIDSTNGKFNTKIVWKQEYCRKITENFKI